MRGKQLLKCKKLKLSLAPALNLQEETDCASGKESLLIPLWSFFVVMKGKAAWLYLEVQVEAGVLLPWRPGVAVLQAARCCSTSPVYSRRKSGKSGLTGERAADNS